MVDLQCEGSPWHNSLEGYRQFSLFLFSLNFMEGGGNGGEDTANSWRS